jgi:hypothetical protein
VSIPGIGVTVYAHVRAEATIRSSGQCLVIADEAHPLAPTVYLALADLPTLQRIVKVLLDLGDTMVGPAEVTA